MAADGLISGGSGQSEKDKERTIVCMALKQILAFHCAPVLMGRKVSNLIVVDRDMEPYMEEAVKVLEWKPNRVTALSFYCDGARSVIFLYNGRQLGAWLKRAENKRFLKSSGYLCTGVEHDISRLKNQYSRYRLSEIPFPHEIGLFLGYPLWDVKGFIDHKGRESRYTGYWKVYDRLPQARRMFLEYERCRQVMTGRAGF